MPPQETIGGESYPWLHVGLANGQEGYVYGKFARSTTDYRAIFVKRNGGRIMSTFIAGD